MGQCVGHHATFGLRDKNQIAKDEIILVQYASKVFSTVAPQDKVISFVHTTLGVTLTVVKWRLILLTINSKCVGYTL